MFLLLKFGFKIEIYLFSVTVFILSFIIFYYNTFDVDIFLSDKKSIVIKNYFMKKEFTNKNFKIGSIFIVSIIFGVYKLKFSTGESYRFRTYPIKSELFYQNKFSDNALKIENEFKNLLG